MGVRARGREERMRRGRQEEGGRVWGGGCWGGEGEGEGVGVSISMVEWGLEGWELFIVDWEGSWRAMEASKGAVESDCRKNVWTWTQMHGRGEDVQQGVVVSTQ